ncbi:MAG: hypothetical protein NT036_01095 [Candidatus Omnitrophica bacterium]|nr:hypothetical protein [Candidatus Omnitrophota bacterium]
MLSKPNAATIVSIAALLVAAVYLIFININLKNAIISKEREFDSIMLKEREEIKSDFKEKFRDDLASYEEAHKMLEREKQRVRLIENGSEKNSR